MSTKEELELKGVGLIDRDKGKKYKEILKKRSINKETKSKKQQQ